MYQWIRTFGTRICLLPSFAAALACLAASASAQVTRGPYLQQASDTSVTVRWRSASPTESTVLIGTEPGVLSAAPESTAGPVSEHVVTLGNLSPHTRYYYAIEESGSVVAGGDLSTWFETSPPTGAVKATRIWVIGDSGEANTDARNVYDAYLGSHGDVYTDLWLMLGDNAYDNGTDSEYQAAVFDFYPELLLQSPLWPTIGNHDTGSTYFDVFTLPTAAEAGGTASSTESYYSFQYGNIHFVVLDSDDSDRSVGGTMYDWLEADLQAAVAAGDTDWLIAFWHHPPYTKGTHDSDSEGRLVDMRTNFLPLLELYGVDLVLTGHSHSYERSFLLDGHYGASATFDAGIHAVDAGDGQPGGTGAYSKTTLGHGTHEGAVYSVVGSSSKTGSPSGPQHAAMFLYLQELASMVLDVNGAELHATVLGDDATTLDHFTLVKGPLQNSSSISGMVWNDLDGDGLRAGGEPFLSGIPVELRSGNGVLLATDTTSGSGLYGFSQLNAGEYRLRIRPGTRVLTTEGVGGDPSLDSDFDEARGHHELTLVENQSVASIDAGLLDATHLGGGIVSLADVDVEPYAGLDEPGGGTAESREAGAAYYTEGNRWVQTLQTFDIDADTVLSFEFRSQGLGAPSAIGFDDDGDPGTRIRLFDLADSGALVAQRIPQSYEGGGSWQTYRIPVGRFFTGNGLRLVLGASAETNQTEYLFVEGQPVEVDGVPTGPSYASTHDAELREGEPGDNFDEGTGDPNAEFHCDADDPNGSGHQSQVAIRFDSIFGAAAWQVPPGSTISEAELFIDVDETGDDVDVHQLVTGFGDEALVTWNSVGGGFVAGVDTTGTPAVLNGGGNKELLDVTASVADWSSGATNHGWVFLASGDDGVEFDASENSDPADRPALRVRAVSSAGGAETEIRNVRVLPEPGVAAGLGLGAGLLAGLARRRAGWRP